jgi:hypothetical protein
MEVATAYRDNRPAIWLEEVDGAQMLNLKTPNGPYLGLKSVKDVRVANSHKMLDFQAAQVDNELLSY